MIGTTINGKYRLLAELGHGAMGVVYRAEQLDVEGGVQRLVAVKTLKGELSVDPTFAQRFLQEIHVTMLLNHPHIVTVYDSGRDETGQLYFTMELVHGQTLRELLRAEGTVSVERMLHIAGHICEALAEAHSRPEPIVHRDLKPENIFLAYRPEQDWVKVGDFGIAKVVGEHTGGLTHTGMSPGTPRYMAPEQCVGKAVDNRTDLYAVGVMMYEMLLGQPPFTADSEYALLRKHVEEPPPPLPATIPVGIRTQIERLLAKAPQDRPADALRVRQALANSSQPQGEPATIIHGRQEREAPQPALPIPSATTLVQGHPGGGEAPALPPSLGQARTRKADGVSWCRRLTARWVATGVGLCGVTLSVLWLMSPLFLPVLSSYRTPEVQAPALPFPDKPSIAVLPFTNMSGDPEQEYFSDGITDDLITDISKISGLSVKARNSVFTYKGKAIKVEEVRRELEVRYVVEGSVRRVSDRVRINVQLVDAITDTHLWADRYDREWKDIFALQDEILTKIIFALKVTLSPEEQERFRHAPTDNLEAYDFYLRGLAAYGRFTQEDNAQARQMFEKAIALDSEYAGAYTYLGWTHWIDGIWEWSPPPQATERAFAAAQRAVALNDSLAGAHALLGAVYLSKNQYEKAIAEMERAIALDPNSAEAYVPLAEPLDFVKQPEATREAVEEALRRHPLYPGQYLYDLGVAYFRTGRYQKAIALLEKVVRLNPQEPFVHADLAFTLLMGWISQQNSEPQTLEQALENAQRAFTLKPHRGSSGRYHLLLSRVYVWQKRYEEALAEAEQAIAHRSSADSYANLAGILNFAGQPEKAIAAAEHALRYSPPNPVWPLTALGEAYYLRGRMEEAINTQKRVLSYEPEYIDGHLNLAILYSESGQEQKAKAEAAEFLRLIVNPNFSLEILGQRLPYKDPAVVERILNSLRKAGLK